MIGLFLWPMRVLIAAVSKHRTRIAAYSLLAAHLVSRHIDAVARFSPVNPARISRHYLSAMTTSPPLTFQLPSSASAFTSASDSDLKAARVVVEQLEQLPVASPALDILHAIDRFHQLVYAQSSQSGLFREVHPDKEIREAATAAEQAWDTLKNEFKLNAKVFERLNGIDLASAGLDKETSRWVKQMLRDYRREGIDQNEAMRNQVKALKDEITKVSQEFSKVISADTRTVYFKPAVLDGLPQDYVDAHKPNEDGAVAITTDYPDIIPFLQYCKDESARREMSIINRQRGHPENLENLLKLFSKRQELASLLGYKSYADYQLEVEMVGSGQNVDDFVRKIDGLAKSRAESDLEELGQLKKQLGSDNPPQIYDESFLSTELKKTKYALDHQALRQYFPFGRVRDGILAATARIFGVRFEKVEAPVWHPDVVAYHMYEDDVLAGRFYLDLHPRENKYKHAAEFDLRQGTPRQLPEASLVCNFPKGDDSLMEHTDVTTFFHEFGHLLHHLLAKNKWTDLAGITCNWDFVEAPSQMLEEWSFDPGTLKTMAVNAKGESIPDEMIAALRRSRAQGRGIKIRQQMLYAMSSLSYHLPTANLSAPDDIDRVATEVASYFGSYPHIPETHMCCSFGHLGGYAAAYYCYMWSQVIAQDMFTRFEEKGLYDPTVTKEYKTKVLARGGSEDAKEFVKDFLGRPYAFDSFSRYLEEGRS